MLRFQAETVVLFVRFATEAFHRSVQEIARVELDARLRGQHGQRSSALRVGREGCFVQWSLTMLQDEVMVVASGQFELRVVLADPLDNGRKLAQVEWRTVHRLKLSGRNQGAVHGCEAICVEAN